ncbi:S1 family peptidase [Methylobacterium sp. sgz302541]|uniref:S1 family peptidase n=1 Tax=unclassified Methylobacterium TaxID=2615210 RepID=UPI003D34B596
MGVRIVRAGRLWLGLLLAAASGPAWAVAGGREVPEDGTGVMVLSSKGGVCTGVVVARDAILTAAHCAPPGAELRAHFREGAEPVLADIAARAVHPGYDAGAVAGRRRSVDLALLRTAKPLPDRFRAALLGAVPPRAGENVTLSGYGATPGGGPRSTGTLRAVNLPVVEPYGPSRILLWLKGPGGACQGDSGGPIAAGDAVVAVSAWSGGACGSLTQGVLIGPQRAWIDATLSAWGAGARWQ